MSSLRVHFVFYCLLYVSSFVSVSSLPEGFPLPTSTSYGTLGIETDSVIENNVYMFSSEHIITTPGSIDRFTIALHGDRNYPFTPILRFTASIEIVVARRVDGGEYFIQTARTREYTGVQHLVEYTLDTPFVVQQDDLIGFHITTPGVYAAWDDPGSSVGALPSSIRKREETEAVDRPNIRFPPINPMISIWYTSSSEGNVALSTEQTTAKPRFTFTVEQGVEITLPTATIPPIDDPQTTLPPRNNAPTGGDPQIGGFQGQSYQFHGLADEIFNLISTPTMQLNSHFVYLSSGKCDYNNTVCFQHPGTYLDVLGFTIPSQQGDVHVKFVAGSHEKGLRVWMGHGDAEMTEISVGKYKHGLKWVMGNDTTQIASVKYNTFGEAEISTPLIHIKVINSDYFFNLEVSLLDRELLRIGSTKHTITDHNICHHDKHGHAQVNEAGENLHAQHDHGMVEAQLMKKYHTDFPIHGLIGQTWRNVLVCGKHWMGGVNDYVVSSLFGSDYFYNFYKSQ